MCYTYTKIVLKADKERIMKKLGGRKIALIASIAILVVSLVVTLCDALVPLNIWVHPILTFLFCAFVGFGAMLLACAFIKHSPFYFFLSAGLLGLALFYAVINYTEWWIALIALFVTWGVFACLSFLVNGNKTEDIALNKSENYKNYEQRRAEKQAAEAKEEENPKELPKIKSFK